MSFGGSVLRSYRGFILIHAFLLLLITIVIVGVALIKIFTTAFVFTVIVALIVVFQEYILLCLILHVLVRRSVSCRRYIIFR